MSRHFAHCWSDEQTEGQAGELLQNLPEAGQEAQPENCGELPVLECEGMYPACSSNGRLSVSQTPRGGGHFYCSGAF